MQKQTQDKGEICQSPWLPRLYNVTEQHSEKHPKESLGCFWVLGVTGGSQPSKLGILILSVSGEKTKSGLCWKNRFPKIIFRRC